MAMIKEALAGNVKAYVAIKDVLGQTSKSDTDLEEQQLRMAATKSKLGNVKEKDVTPDKGGYKTKYGFEGARHDDGRLF